MKRGRRELSPEEQRLWRRATSGAKARQSKTTAQPAEGAAPRTSKQPPPAIPIRLSPTKQPPPANRTAEKRVRRGRIDIGAKLDLHGHTQTTARVALARFLEAARRRGDKTVIVITGVGRAGEGVLKRRLPEWLAEPGVRELVSGYAKAHRTHGGEGAYYVFLKRAE